MMADIEHSKSRKESLEQNSKKHREAFEHELSDVIDRTKKATTTALVVGGGFALTYILFRKMAGGKTVKKKRDDNGQIKEVVINKSPSLMRTVGNVILTEAAIFCVGVAKEKLTTFIDNAKAHENEHP